MTARGWNSQDWIDAIEVDMKAACDYYRLFGMGKTLLMIDKAVDNHRIEKKEPAFLDRRVK